MHRSRADFSSGLSLYGYDIEGAQRDISLPAGDNLRLIIYWQAVQPVSTGLTALVHLVPVGIYDQPPLAQHDGPPCFQSYPTSEWKVGEIVMDWFDIPLPLDLPPGDYELAAGWYNPETMERDSTVEADHPLPDGRAVIGKIEVAAP